MHLRLVLRSYSEIREMDAMAHCVEQAVDLRSDSLESEKRSNDDYDLEHQQKSYRWRELPLNSPPSSEKIITQGVRDVTILIREQLEWHRISCFVIDQLRLSCV